MADGPESPRTRDRIRFFDQHVDTMKREPDKVFGMAAERALTKRVSWIRSQAFRLLRQALASDVASALPLPRHRFHRRPAIDRICCLGTRVEGAAPKSRAMAAAATAHQPS